jgi:hypothetical protein
LDGRQSRPGEHPGSRVERRRHVRALSPLPFTSDPRLNRGCS